MAPEIACFSGHASCFALPCFVQMSVTTDMSALHALSRMGAFDADTLAARFSADICGSCRGCANPFAIAQSAGIRIVDGERPRTDGRVIYVPESMSLEQQAWFVAHELGHIILSRYGWQQSESRADAIALALMLPKDSVLRDVGELGSSPARLRSRYPHCSAHVIARRLSELGVSSGFFAAVQA